MGGRGSKSGKTKETTSSKWKTQSLEHRYAMLDRLRMDNEYFLGNGNGAEKHLWAGSVEEQLQTMKDIYNSFTKDQRPEWLSMDQIKSYEKIMKERKYYKGVTDIAQEIRNLEKQLATAKAQVTRQENKYLAASGAERAFDWKSGPREEREKVYQTVRERRNKAYKAYREAQEKRQDIEKKIRNLTSKIKRGTKNT